MAQIGVSPFVLKNATLKIALDNYEKSVSAVECVPSSSIVNWKGLTPTAVFSFGTNSTWTCNLAYAQDWATADSLSRYLHDNEGSSVLAEFYPEAGGTGFAVTLLIAPGSIGGAVDSVAVSTVSLGISGKPAEIAGV